MRLTSAAKDLNERCSAKVGFMVPNQNAVPVSAINPTPIEAILEYPDQRAHNAVTEPISHPAAHSTNAMEPPRPSDIKIARKSRSSLCIELTRWAGRPKIRTPAPTITIARTAAPVAALPKSNNRDDSPCVSLRSGCSANTHPIRAANGGKAGKMYTTHLPAELEKKTT